MTEINYNGITDPVLFAKGEITQTAFLEANGCKKNNYKALSDELKPALRTLAEKYERLATDNRQLTTEKERYRTKSEQLQQLFEQARTDAETARIKCEHFAVENEHLATDNRQLTTDNRQLRTANAELLTYKNAHEGQDSFISFMGSYKAENIILILLALFGVVGTFDLLWATAPVLAACVSLPLGLVLIHFTAKGETAAKIFCMLYDLAVLGIFFEVLPEAFAKYVFWITPVVIVGLIAFGKRLGKIDR